MKDEMCFFIGHRNIPYSIKKQLTKVVEKHIVEYGVTTFIVGHYGSFDSLVQEVLSEIKQHYVNIRLYLLLPYYQPFNSSNGIPKSFDGAFYPEGIENVPKPYAIVYANKYMIEHSNYLVSYYKHIGNTRKFIEFAQKREKKGLIKITLL